MPKTQIRTIRSTGPRKDYPCIPSAVSTGPQIAAMAENDGRKAAGVDEIEKAPQRIEQPEENVTYDHDDIHQAALADNPTKAEKPSWSTLLSIAVSSGSRRPS